MTKKHHHHVILLTVTIVLASVLAPGWHLGGKLKVFVPPAPAPSESGLAQAQEAYGKIPLSFEANYGQADSQVRFLARGGGYQLSLTSTGAILQMHGEALQMQLVGSQSPAQVEGLEELPGKVNSFIGNDPRRWHTNIPTYAKVRFQNIYPGISLVYYGRRQQLEYDFLVAPSADPALIRIAFSGARQISLDSRGDLVLQIGEGELRLHKPVAYQEVDGVRREIPTEYMLMDRQQVGFTLEDYDVTNNLIIDPMLTYSTFYGSNGNDEIKGIATDGTGSAYMIGENRLPGDDAFVIKLNSAGSGIDYRTDLVGNKFVSAGGIAVDAAGSVYVTGGTSSTDFPVKPLNNAVQPTLGSNLSEQSDAFALKLDRYGNIEYATYLGGVLQDTGRGIAVDAVGNAYVTGETSSINFPTVNPLQPAMFRHFYFAGAEAFVAKINPTGTALVYSTYLGGSQEDQGKSIAVDAAGQAYVTGMTQSRDFPVTPGAYQSMFGDPMDATGLGDAFVSKVSADGSRLVYSTYLGGADADQGYDIAVDASENAYVTGVTASINVPTINAWKQSPGSAFLPDAFVVKLGPMGDTVFYSTYFGGTRADLGSSIAVDLAGNAYVLGNTNSFNLFTTEDAFQRNFKGGLRDAFILIFNSTGSEILFSSYFGGSADDGGNSIAIDSAYNIYLAGTTRSTDFPRESAMQLTKGLGNDAFVTKISTQPDQLKELRELAPRPKIRRTSPGTKRQ